MTALTGVRVGTPLRHDQLTVFPVFTDLPPGPEYVLADRAVAGGSVRIEEVSEEGKVPLLLVVNEGEDRVLFLEGQEIRGAKQNRVVNTTVLVPPRSRTTIPVSCVEQGRWHYRSARCGEPSSHAPARLRHILKRSVTDCALLGLGHVSDQLGVWREVTRQLTAHGSHSETLAMADTFERRREDLSEFRRHLGYVAGAAGLAVALDGGTATLDLFSRPETCQQVWDRLLSGAILDALEERQERSDGLNGLRAERVRLLIDRLAEIPWSPAPAAGEGREYRVDDGGRAYGSALVLDGHLIHASVTIEAGA